MPPAAGFPFVAVDVGNSRIKFGLFERVDAKGLPEPAAVLDLEPVRDSLDRLQAWLEPIGGPAAWWVASVNRPHATRLVEWIRRRQPDEAVTLLASGDLPLSVSLPRPDMVGIDRLAGAVAANHLRQPGRAAIVVDLGTAITVDLVSGEGAFLGGAILPGIGMSARALHELTDLLPLLDMTALAEPPPPLGTATIEALRSGLYWGAVGGVKELIARLGSPFDEPPEVFLTGGAAPVVAPLLSSETRYLPHLVLAGIALAAHR